MLRFVVWLSWAGATAVACAMGARLMWRYGMTWPSLVLWVCVAYVCYEVASVLARGPGGA